MQQISRTLAAKMQDPATFIACEAMYRRIYSANDVHAADEFEASEMLSAWFSGEQDKLIKAGCGEYEAEDIVCQMDRPVFVGKQIVTLVNYKGEECGFALAAEAECMPKFRGRGVYEV